jgi:hypothetical protein
MSTHEPTECTCPKGRPLSAGHLPDCPVPAMEDDNVVALYRGEDGRVVAVPGEVVIEAEREYRAYLEYAKSKSWEQVAEAEGYADAKAAQAAVKRYLDEGKAIVGDLSRKDMLAVEVGQLRMLRESLWESAMLGKVSAVMAALAVHDRMVKIFGLDTGEEAATEAGRTVVTIDPNTYTEGLRAVAGES